MINPLPKQSAISAPASGKATPAYTKKSMLSLYTLFGPLVGNFRFENLA
jgi:hypothetical protein